MRLLRQYLFAVVWMGFGPRGCHHGDDTRFAPDYDHTSSHPESNLSQEVPSDGVRPDQPGRMS